MTNTARIFLSGRVCRIAQASENAAFQHVVCFNYCAYKWRKMAIVRCLHYDYFVFCVEIVFLEEWIVVVEAERSRQT